jgi:hypothetical protein
MDERKRLPPKPIAAHKGIDRHAITPNGVDISCRRSLPAGSGCSHHAKRGRSNHTHPVGVGIRRTNAARGEKIRASETHSHFGNFGKAEGCRAAVPPGEEEEGSVTSDKCESDRWQSGGMPRLPRVGRCVLG